MKEILVTVICTAFQHEKYIRKCLDGFVMQKTNFAFQVLVHDDASTDKTADIVKEYEARYPGVIVGIYQTKNQYSQHVNISKNFFLPLVKGKYIAICEGDDFWTDEDKLQKQYNIMESNLDCYMCTHKVAKISESGVRLGTFYPNTELNEGKYDIIRMLGLTYPFHTSSYFMRMESWKEFIENPPNFKKICDVGDVPMVLYFSSLGAIYYMSDLMSCRRYGVPTAWTVKFAQNSGYEDFRRKNYEHALTMFKTYCLFDEFTNGRVHAHLCGLIAHAYWEKCVIGGECKQFFSSKEWCKVLSYKHIFFAWLGTYFPKTMSFLYLKRREYQQRKILFQKFF